MGQPGNICAICGANYRADALFCPQDGAPLGTTAPIASDPLVGTALPGEIRIEKLIGVGAAGRVYRGFQEGVDRAVAVKVLHAELSADGTVVARFQREARIASLLSHPHVVDVFVAGQLPPESPGAGTLYIVMEYVDGISLRSALAAGDGAIKLQRALRIVLQICDAVGEAHARGIVHRDLKPENVMLVPKSGDKDFVKVLDFGLARLPAGSGPVLTRAGLVFGTARYISPEGAAGQPVGPAGDVYAVATILYQMLAGRTPFEGESAVEVLARQIDAPPPPLRSHARAFYVPEPIADVIGENLAKRPEERRPDARALARALLDAARRSGLSPDALVLRSSLLGEMGHERAFVSAEPTRKLELGATPTRRFESHPSPAETTSAPPARAERFSRAASDEDAPSAPSSSPEPPLRSSAGARSSTRGTLAFLLWCVAGGSALAVLGARLGTERQPPALEPALDAVRATSPTASLDAAATNRDGGAGAR